MKRRAFTAFVIVVLSGMPSVAVACAALCTPAMTSPHAHCHDADVPVKLSPATPGCCQVERAPDATVATMQGVIAFDAAPDSPAVVALFDRGVAGVTFLIDQRHGPPLRLASGPLPLRI